VAFLVSVLRRRKCPLNSTCRTTEIAEDRVRTTEIAEDRVRAALVNHPDEKAISLVAISVSHLESDWALQAELPFGLEDEKRRPGTQAGMARCSTRARPPDPFTEP
jgi:DNA polymerase-4